MYIIGQKFEIIMIYWLDGWMDLFIYSLFIYVFLSFVHLFIHS